MVDLKSITEFCDQRTLKDTLSDFDNAYNGLQLENNGIVTKIGAAVDAGQIPFELAIQEKSRLSYMSPWFILESNRTDYWAQL